MIAATAQGFLTSADIIARFGVTRATLRLWILDGKFPAPLRVGGKRYWRPATVEAFVSQREAVANAATR